MKHRDSITVQAVVDLGHFIGTCDVEIATTEQDFVSDGYFEVVAVSNKYGDVASEGKLEAINQDADLMQEIAKEVMQYYVASAEAAADALEDR